jgi:hypothetical protein
VSGAGRQSFLAGIAEMSILLAKRDSRKPLNKPRSQTGLYYGSAATVLQIFVHLKLKPNAARIQNDCEVLEWLNAKYISIK